MPAFPEIVVDKTNKRSSLSPVLARKFGYSDIETMKIDSRRRFSLLENGILDQPSTRLLVINVSHLLFDLHK